MTELESIITELIKAVKQNEAFSDIRFVNAYNKKPAEKPVTGCIAVVEMAGINNGVKLNVRLIGGSDISGAQLGYTAVELAAAINEADIDKVIDSVYLSETGYDNKISAFYRDIKLSLNPVAAGLEDEESVELYLNGELLRGVSAFKWEEKSEAVSLYEFNRGEPYAIINSKSYYDIVIEADTLSVLNFDNGFSLSVEVGGVATQFMNCVINRISAVVNTNGKIVYKITIKSDKKVTA